MQNMINLTNMQNMPFIFEKKNTQTLPCTASHSNALASLCKECNIILNCAWGPWLVQTPCSLTQSLWASSGASHFTLIASPYCATFPGVCQIIDSSRITDNKVVVFPPDLRIKEAKSNGVGAGGCCSMDGPICGCMSSSALPTSARSSGCNRGSSSSLESSYPGTRKIIRCRVDAICRIYQICKIGCFIYRI